MKHLTASERWLHAAIATAVSEAGRQSLSGESDAPLDVIIFSEIVSILEEAHYQETAAALAESPDPESLLSDLRVAVAAERDRRRPRNALN